MLCDLICYFLGNVLGLAGLLKWSDLQKFQAQVTTVLPLPQSLIALVPCVEIVSAFALLSGFRAGLHVCLVLYSVFLVLIIYLYWKHDTVGCHCFGSFSSAQVDLHEVARNSLLLALCVYADCTAAAVTPFWFNPVLFLVSLSWVMFMLIASQMQELSRLFASLDK